MLLTVLYFAWEAGAYRGLFAYLCEWQFDHIGQDLPTFTFGVLTTIVAWPALRLFRRRLLTRPALTNDATTEERARHAAESERRDMAAAIFAARDYMHFLYGFAVALGIAAAVALAWTLFLPRMSGAMREVSISDTAPPEGPVKLSGTVDYGRVASFSRGILFVRRAELYAPIIPRDVHADPVRYFVEFAPEERGEIHNGAQLNHRAGILVRSDLPGALVRLYRYLGYEIARPYHVLYASPFTIRWPYYLIAFQFSLGSLAFLIAGLLQRRHTRRRIADYEERHGRHG